MQDEMVAELKAAGSSVPGGGGLGPVSAKESSFTDTVVHDWSVKSHGSEDLDEMDSTPKAAASRQVSSLNSSAKKRPVSSQPPPAKRGRVGGKPAGKGRKKPGRPAASSMKGGAKKPTRTRLSISDFDGVTQVRIQFRLCII